MFVKECFRKSCRDDDTNENDFRQETSKPKKVCCSQLSFKKKKTNRSITNNSNKKEHVCVLKIFERYEIKQ